MYSGSAPPQVRAQRVRRRRRPRRRRPPAAARPARRRARDHGASAHRRVRAQRRLHLARLDAEAADLHLRVQAAEELQRRRRAPAHPVARAVQPRAGRAANGIGDEALGRERRAGPGSRAPRPSPPAYSSPGTPGGHGAQRRVQHVHARCWRWARRSGRGRRSTPPGDRVAAGEGGVLRGPVAVDQPQPGKRSRTRRTRPGEHVAAGQELAHAGQVVRPLLHHSWKSPAVSQSVVTPCRAIGARPAPPATGVRAGQQHQRGRRSAARPRSPASTRRTRPARPAGSPRPAPQAGVVRRRAPGARRRGAPPPRPWACPWRPEV